MADRDWDQLDSDNPLSMHTDGAGGLVQVRTNACVKKELYGDMHGES